MTTTITLEKLSTENTNLKLEINKLKEELSWFYRQIYGKKSEKIIPTNEEQLEFDLGLPPLPPKEKKVKVDGFERGSPKKDGKDKITLPNNLPVESQILDLTEEEKKCQETGKPLVKIGEEVTRKLAYKPGSYFIKEFVRIKYALPQGSEGGIVTPALPESLLSRCIADDSFLADILVKKFGDHLPLYRISEMLSRENIKISRQIICQWVVRAGQALMPLHNEMFKKAIQSGYIYADETPIDMLSPGKGKTHQAYMWLLVGGKENPSYKVYNFRTNRQHNNIFELLKGFKGLLHSDKYGAYENLANRKQMTWCPCWAHIRRKFIDESGDPDFRKWVLRKIRYLYWYERVGWARSPEERLRIRKEKEIPIIDELIKAIKDKLILGDVLPKSKFREALGYFCSLIPHLKNYTQDPWARIDNNIAERAIRPLAIGRKNWLFVGSKEAGEAAAVILSLVQTCRSFEVNPREYLEDVMRRLMSHNSQKLDELLPDQWKINRK